MPHRPQFRLTAVAASALLMSAAVALACASPSSGSSGCITTLPVSVSFPSQFAPFYRRTLPVIIQTKGPPIRHLTATLYTFGGEKLGSGAFRKTIFSSNQLKVRLRFPMQPGSFTLALFGEPNADPSCGPKHSFIVVRFLPCPHALPVTFPNPPGGRASDYGDSVSIDVATTGYVIKHLTVSLSSFDGTQVGSRSFSILFGQVTATFDVAGGLQPGGYTVFVSGAIKGLPASCGPKSAKTVLSFT